MSSISMTATDLLPKPYIFPQKKKSRPMEKFDLHLPNFVRQYSGDRHVQLRSCEYTMQQARKDLDSKTLDCDVPSHSRNHRSKQKTDEFNCEEVAVNRFREWKPEDESFVFNIRPGRKMFPFLRDVIEAEDKYRENGSDGDVNIQEETTLRSELFEYSVAPSNIVLTRNASSFVCESQEHDQIVEVI